MISAAKDRPRAGGRRILWFQLLVASCLSILLLVVAPCEGWAQDSHYWNEQYGTRANLLGGVVIGSVSDVSATYYNPGALGLFEDTSILVATRAYEYVGLNYSDGAGEGIDLGSSRLNVAPDFIAGEIPFTWLGSNRIAYSVLTRQNQEFDLRANLAEPNPDGSPPAEDLAAGSVRIRQRFSEYWFGLSWSKPLSSTVGIGITGYAAARSQQWRVDASADVARAGGSPVQGVGLTEDARYWNVRLLAKLGVGIKLDPLTLGATLTTPSQSVVGGAEYLYRRFSTGLPEFDPPYRDPYLAQNFQQDLGAFYRSRWAAGFGGSYRFGSTRIHLSVEWFDAVREYSIFQTESFFPQSGGAAIDTSLRQALREVWNWGLGLEFPVSHAVNGYTSFTKDSSAAERNNLRDISVSEWDIRQLSAGVEVKLAGNNALTCGLAYAWGERPVSLGLDWEAGSPSVLPAQTRVVYQRIRVLLGISVAF